MATQPIRLDGDEDHAPLLRDPEAENANGHGDAGRTDHWAHEPLTPLTKILLILALVLLLLSSVFIGLFAGVNQKLKEEKKHRHDGGYTVTSTIFATDTVSRTATFTATTTLKTTSIGITTTTAAPSPTGPPNSGLCLSQECILLSGSILSSIDTSQDPCENFYDYATGGWRRDHPLPADKGRFGNFDALSQKNKQVVQRILESSEDDADAFQLQASASGADKELIHKLKDFYQSCLNEDWLDSIGTLPLFEFVEKLRKRYRGEDPNSLVHGKTDLTAALAFLHSHGIESLFSIQIEGDVGKDPNHMIPWFSQPSLGLPSKDYYKDNDVVEFYQGVVEKLLVIISEADEKHADEVYSHEKNYWPPWPWPPWGNDDKDGGHDDKPGDHKRRAAKLARGIIQLEKDIAKASLDLDILWQDPIATYNPKSFFDLASGLPQIDFPTYISAFTPRRFPDRVIVTYPPYINSLANILDDTSSEVIEAYLIVRAALDLVPFLGMSTEAWKTHRSLVEFLTGVKKGAVGNRAEYCVGRAEQALGFAVGRYFVEETFGGDSKEKGTKVIKDIIGAFKESLHDVDWMDKKSAKAAAQKADALRIKVGYPISPDTEDPESLLRYYRTVKIDKINFFDNMLSASKAEQFRVWSYLGRQRDLDGWEMYPSIVNAYFNPPSNEIVFPAGILQPPFFQSSWPAYISYGAFGHVAAHELTHAFDSAGRLYNQEGKLEQWWTNATSEGFQRKQDCIVKQFSDYTVEDGHGGVIHVNGNLTSGENIGDTGLIQAYRAWKKQYASSFMKGNEFLLPGLDFTREQLFFISFARIWATSINTATAVQLVRTDPHSPARYRVDGTVFNIPEFAEAFKCPKKSKLNPPKDKRCIFWS